VSTLVRTAHGEEGDTVLVFADRLAALGAIEEAIAILQSCSDLDTWLDYKSVTQYERQLTDLLILQGRPTEAARFLFSRAERFQWTWVPRRLAPLLASPEHIDEGVALFGRAPISNWDAQLDFACLLECAG